MDWWRTLLPVALPDGTNDGEPRRLAYQGAERLLGASEITARESDDQVMLVRNRLSRIYWGGKLFDYPLKPGLDMAAKLGPSRCLRLGASYAYSAVRPIRPEQTLEDFFINRFGRQLYLTFFKEYTEKVWGVPCKEISAAWGAQRVKSLSISKALMHALRNAFGGRAAAKETSLIEHFLYPKFGPGQMWETAADKVQAQGGRVLRQMAVERIEREESTIKAVLARDAQGHIHRLECDNLISTMPIRDLVNALTPAPPQEVLGIGQGLEYRDFITVGLLYRKLLPNAGSQDARTHCMPDNWIYIQEPGVKVGRLQIFNNWSPYMVRDEGTVWVGLEFFARDDDSLWALSDEDLRQLAIQEMQQLRLADAREVLDATVIRMPKAYPGYFGSAYQRFDELRTWLDGLGNLYLIGRNGMHRYNNQDHSMLTAKLAAETIVRGGGDKQSIWAINVDDEYHEEGK